MTQRKRNQHLLWRSGFGPAVHQIQSLDQQDPSALWNTILKDSEKAPVKLEVAENRLQSLFEGIEGEAAMRQFQKENKEAIAEQVRLMRQSSRDDMKKLNHLWMNEMVHSPAQLREKVSFFWHGHFACRVMSAFQQQELLHTIRTHALGNFGDLLRGVSKSPAMLAFLNNQQNRKRSPNENFAREVMELFTLGRGHYTETDVKEAARAFTGWSYDSKSGFEFKPYIHDDGVKNFMGRTGRFTGDDIINILLEQKQTARYITEKIYRFFVHEKPDAEKIQPLADDFFKSGYNIKSLFHNLFSADWFYDSKNIGNRIKSPVEYMAGIRRFVPVTLDNPNSSLVFQQVLGQVLFLPPNVAGWPGGRSWIDSSSLMVRLQLPRIWASKEDFTLQLKGDDDVEMGRTPEEMQAARKARNFISRAGAADWNWEPVWKNYADTSRERLYEEIAAHLLQTKKAPGKQVVELYVDKSSREHYISSTIIQLMSTPEYQVC